MGWDERLGGFERTTSYSDWNYRMLCLRAWRRFARLMERLGNPAARDKYDALADARIAQLRRRSDWYRRSDVHGCAEALQAGSHAGGKPGHCRPGVRRSGRPRLLFAGQHGLDPGGMARADRFDDAICTLKDRWGAIIRYGGTTTLMFHPVGRRTSSGADDPVINGQCGTTSLCHP